MRRFMSQPMGFKTAGKENMVCKLKNSIYGLNNLLDSGTSISTASLEEKGIYAAIVTHVCITTSYLKESTFIYSYM